MSLRSTMSLGTVRNTVPWLRDPYGFLGRAAAEEGRHTFVRDLPVLGRTLFLGDPATIAPAVNHPELDAGRAVVGLRSIMGDDSLIMLDGAAHAQRKQLVARHFRGAVLARYDEMLQHVTRERARALPQRFRAFDLLHTIALDAISRVMFGDRPEVVGRSRHLVAEFLGSFDSPLMLFLRPLQRDWGPWTAWGRALRRRDALRAWCLERMDAGEGLVAELAARADGLEREVLVTEVLALLLFGHDTAAAQMSWALAHLHAHGHTLRARAEPTWLDACLRESMRLCPVVVHLTRVARRPVQLAGFEVAAGQRVAPCSWLVHHNPAVWAEPERFDPTRFEQDLPPQGWFPFGLGARTCVGRPFAMRQMQVVLGTLLEQLHTELAPGYRPTPARRLVLIVPAGGCPLVSTRS